MESLFARLAKKKPPNRKGSGTSSNDFKDVCVSDAFSRNFKTRRTSVEYILGWKWALYSLVFHFVVALSVGDDTKHVVLVPL